MSTGIGCINTTSALRRPLPIADGLTLRGQNRTSRPLRHHRIPPRIIAIPHRRDVSRRFSGRLGAIAPARDPSNPHSRLASPNGSGACRGFLPRGLYDACPRRVSHVLACLRVRAGIAQPLTGADVSSIAQQQTFIEAIGTEQSLGTRIARSVDTRWPSGKPANNVTVPDAPVVSTHRATA